VSAINRSRLVNLLQRRANLRLHLDLDLVHIASRRTEHLVATTKRRVHSLLNFTNQLDNNRISGRHIELRRRRGTDGTAGRRRWLGVLSNCARQESGSKNQNQKLHCM
jgi:hypothetical protein